MQLNLNSLSAKLYRWFYTTSQMPQSLCPYFWKLVLMWVLILPYSLISIPTLIIRRFQPDAKYSTISRFVVSLVVWFIIFILLCMLIAVFAPFFIGLPKLSDDLYLLLFTLGSACWLVTIVYGSGSLFMWAKEKWINRNIKYDEHGNPIWEPTKERQPSIITEFVKASYNKYCPKIDWK